MKHWIVVALALALGIGLFLWMRPAAPPHEATAVPPSPPSAPATAEGGPAAAVPASPPTYADAPVARAFELVVEKRQLVSGESRLQVSQGDAVVIRVTSDAADEFHLHGYDLKLRLVPGQRAALAFTAERSGRFDFELEQAHVELGSLEVQPR